MDETKVILVTQLLLLDVINLAPIEQSRALCLLAN